ncbi:hypothetical protein KSB_46680 [Ktedonobacter robiniae]|uniref:Cas12f1-like TNB domain-containing protein n=2 Tax=Ktedonobacter robiniae TaxID=2778365 RepID=A0ABQ3UU10_9CHLR|nr:hypothetical protein KSB_46680 [Ktedonobacter robiniae]
MAGKPFRSTKTMKQAVLLRSKQANWFHATQTLFNQVASFYFEVIQAHPLILDLSSQEALTALERLTHATKQNPHPVMPLSQIAQELPAMFRRATIHAALGAAHAFTISLAKWRARKEKAQAKQKRFTERPPVPPRTWNRSVSFYAGMWKGRSLGQQAKGPPIQGARPDTTEERACPKILLKLWTGRSWVWTKLRLSGPPLPQGCTPQEAGSPQLVRKGGRWWLHTPLQREIERPQKAQTQLSEQKGTRLCAVDLNIDTHLAVCTIQTVEGTVVATRFIRGGKRLHGLRKRQLGRIARNRRATGIIAEGEQDNVQRWAKVRALDEDTAHQVSHRIVAFAQAHGASILVFEHLGHFKPVKGSFSRRGNEKRSYWLRGRIFRYTRYKAFHQGIITCRVNPRNTSREHADCGGAIARYAYGQPTEGYTPGAPLMYCPSCDARDHADRNASRVIGKRLLARFGSYQCHKEKPHAPLQAERSAKAGGGHGSQAAQCAGEPSILGAGHGAVVAQGTAQKKT